MNDHNKKNDKSNDYYSYDKKEMLKFIPENITNVLEIGCGEGRFGQQLKADRNIDVWGVELFQQAANVAVERFDKVFVGNIECDDIQFQLPDNYFDCIIFNDVLEHLQYPWSLLEKMRIKLKPDGSVVASIPNIRYYQVIKELILEKEFKYTKSGVTDITHFRFFTEKSIRRMFEMSGYKLLTINGINGGFPWKFGLLNKLLFNSFYDMQFLQFACVAVKN